MPGADVLIVGAGLAGFEAENALRVAVPCRYGSQYAGGSVTLRIALRYR